MSQESSYPATINHDRLFKELLTTFFVEFIELFLPEVAAYLDKDSLVALDKEVFTDVTAGEQYETDILMQAKYSEQDSFFLIHVENQSYAQSSFPRRMFDYFAALHSKYDLPVYPIAVFSFDEPQRPEPNVYRVVFPNKTVLEFRYDVVQLNQLNWQDFLDKPNPVSSALMAKMKIVPEDRAKVKLECLKMLVGLDLDPARVQLISGFVDTYLRLNEEEKKEFQAELDKIKPATKEEAMKIVTSWMEEGIEEGLKRGKHELVIRLLYRKLGQLAPDAEQKIGKLEVAQLEELGEALLDFSSPADLENWLQTNAS